MPRAECVQVRQPSGPAPRRSTDSPRPSASLSRRTCNASRSDKGVGCLECTNLEWIAAEAITRQQLAELPITSATALSDVVAANHGASL